MLRFLVQLTSVPALAGMLICFLLGSVPFAVLAMIGSGVDIRRVGSRNPGFNNVLRVSKPRAILVLIGDVGKGVAAALLAGRVLQLSGGSTALMWVFGFAAVLGHCYSPFLKFRGGKGVATSAGVMLVLYPVWALIALIFFVTVRLGAGRLKCKEAGMIASLCTWVFFALLAFIFVGSQAASFAATMTLFLAWRHKRNFQNLLGMAGRSQSVA